MTPMDVAAEARALYAQHQAALKLLPPVNHHHLNKNGHQTRNQIRNPKNQTPPSTKQLLETIVEQGGAWDVVRAALGNGVTVTECRAMYSEIMWKYKASGGVWPENCEEARLVMKAMDSVRKQRKMARKRKRMAEEEEEEDGRIEDEEGDGVEEGVSASVMEEVAIMKAVEEEQEERSGEDVWESVAKRVEGMIGRFVGAEGCRTRYQQLKRRREITWPDNEEWRTLLTEMLERESGGGTTKKKKSSGTIQVIPTVQVIPVIDDREEDTDAVEVNGLEAAEGRAEDDEGDLLALAQSIRGVARALDEQTTMLEVLITEEERRSVESVKHQVNELVQRVQQERQAMKTEMATTMTSVLQAMMG